MILLGVVFRVAISVRAPVSYDEVFVMGLGLDEMSESARDFIAVPLRRSNAITPLWWWVQVVPTLLAGELSLPSLRVMPLALGLATLVLAYLCAAPRVGRGPAALFVAFVAFSDVLAFTHARGEYAESLLMLFVIPAVCLVGVRDRTLMKGSLWALILLTHLGKGLFLVGALALAEVIKRGHSTLFQKGGHSALRSRLPKKTRMSPLFLGIALVPAAIWLMVAASLGSLVTNIGTVHGPLAMLRALTLDYAQTKAHMVASAWDALQVWRDPWSWPLTTLSGSLLMLGAGAALLRRRSRRCGMAVALAVWTALGLVLVLGRGMIGARFHLLYLPALWLLGSIGLWRLARSAAVRSALRRVPAGIGVPAALLLSGAIVLGILTRGPLRWVPFSRFEPFAGSDELAGIEAHRRRAVPLPGPHGRTLYIDLANYFLVKKAPTPRDLDRARHFAELEVQRVPHDARAWFFLAKARQRLGEPPERVLEAAHRSQELSPSSQTVKLIEEMEDG